MGNDSDNVTENAGLGLTERVINALQDTTASTTIIVERMNALERGYGEFKEELKDEMRTMNANLDRIARESSITNDLLRIENERREREQQEEEEQKREERQNARDRKKLVLNIFREVWNFINKPASVILMAAAAYIAYTYFDVNKQSAPMPETSPVETTTEASADVQE